mmetsp:Transcript_2437/g.5716  ORF Transcript_2437/g.5716 Transcript_2437/m.5716 type:complete len:224 (+) Transcript_2437:38-709(+)
MFAAASASRGTQWTILAAMGFLLWKQIRRKKNKKKNKPDGPSPSRLQSQSKSQKGGKIAGSQGKPRMGFNPNASQVRKAGGRRIGMANKHRGNIGSTSGSQLPSGSASTSHVTAHSSRVSKKKTGSASAKKEDRKQRKLARDHDKLVQSGPKVLVPSAVLPTGSGSRDRDHEKDEEKGEETYTMGYTYTTTVTDARVQAVASKAKSTLAKPIPKPQGNKKANA